MFFSYRARNNVRRYNVSLIYTWGKLAGRYKTKSGFSLNVLLINPNNILQNK